MDLSYRNLKEMAVTPAEKGAYRDSPLAPSAGLHVHSGDDAVHVVVSGVKIAEVRPDGTEVMIASPDAGQQKWLRRIAGEETS